MVHVRKANTVDPQEDPSREGEPMAKDVVARSLEIAPQSGVLRIADERYLILRPEMIVNIQKQLEQTVGASTKGFLYLAGERSGDEHLHAVRAFLGPAEGPEDFASVARRTSDALALAGWGRYVLLAQDRESGVLSVALENSPIAHAYGPSARPVCHLVAGWLAAFGRRLLGRELLCEEVSCKAQGRPRCEFVLSPLPSHLR